MIVFQNSRAVALDSQTSFERFARDFRLVHAAGGIVADEQNRILMIFRLGCWDFPKGKTEPGEQYAQTALREVLEETGVHALELGHALPETYHTYTLRGEPILKVTHWFAMHAASQPLVPQTEEDITQADWIPASDVAGKLQDSYPSLAHLWAEVSSDFCERKDEE